MKREVIATNWLDQGLRWRRRATPLLLVLVLAGLAACGRDNPGRQSPGAMPAVPTQAATATPTPSPSPTYTATPSPTPTPMEPPFPTPDVDLIHTAIYRQTLKPALAGDAEALPGAPRYFIQARLIPGASPVVTGVQRVRYTNQEDIPLAEIYFQLYPNLPAYDGAARVERAIVNSRLVTPTLELEGSALRLPLDRPLAPGAVADITLWFDAELPTSVVAGSAGSGLYAYVDGVYDLAGFYPTLAVYDDEGWNLEITATFGDSPFTDIAFYWVELIAPSDQTVVAAGSSVRQTDNDDGTTTWSILAGPVRAFYAAMSNHWDMLSQEVDGTVVHSYYPPGGLVSAQTALTYAAGSLRVFDRLFGVYPYRELDLAPVPTTAFGMEYPGVIALAASFYTPDGGAFAVATPHEVAHQWFYNLVGNDQPDEPWLDESLANYAVYLYYEAVDRPEMRDSVMNNVFLYRYNAARNLDRDRPVVGPVTGFDRSSYINIVYGKGPLFFHAVRQRIGDEAFFAALRDYVDAHRYGIAYPDDLFAAFRRHSDVAVDDLVRFWLTGD